MIMCVLLCYPVSIRIYYQQGVLFLVCFVFEMVKVSEVVFEVQQIWGNSFYLCEVIKSYTLSSKWLKLFLRNVN